MGRSDRGLARPGRLSSLVVGSAGILAARPQGGEATWFWPYPGGVLQAAAIPVGGRAQPLGTLIMGFSLDEAAARGIKARTNSDIVLVAGSRVVASTFSAALSTDLARLVDRRGSFDVWIGRENYIGRAQPLDPADAAHGPVAIVLRSRTEHLRFLDQLHRDIALTGLVAVLVAT